MEVVSTIIGIVEMAMVVQFLVDRVKGIFPAIVMKYITPPVWSIAISIVIAFMFNLDLFSLLGWQSAWPYLPQIFTGLAISAGADPLYNLIKKIRELRTTASDE